MCWLRGSCLVSFVLVCETSSRFVMMCNMLSFGCCDVPLIVMCCVICWRVPLCFVVLWCVYDVRCCVVLCC